MPNAGGVSKSFVFRPVEKSPAQTPNRRKFVSIGHDGALAEVYAVSSTTLIVVKV